MPTNLVAADLATSLDAWFKDCAPKAQAIDVAVGYFDKTMADRLLEVALPKAGETRRKLRVVLNADGEVSLGALESLLKAQTQDPNDVEVWCVRKQGGLFHPKVYAAYGADAVTLVVGSGNLTQAAKRNQEMYCYLTLAGKGELAAKLKRIMDQWARHPPAQKLSRDLIDSLSGGGDGPEGEHPSLPIGNALKALALGCLVTPAAERPTFRRNVPPGILGKVSGSKDGGAGPLHTWMAGVVQLIPPEKIKQLGGIEHQIGAQIRRFGLELPRGQFFVPVKLLDELHRQARGFASKRGALLKETLTVPRIRKHFKEARARIDEELLAQRTFESPAERAGVVQRVEEFLALAQQEVEQRKARWCSPDAQTIRTEPHPVRVRFTMSHDPAWPSQPSAERQLADALLDVLEAQLDAITDAARLRNQPSRGEATRRARDLQILTSRETEDLIKKIEQATRLAARKSTGKAKKKKGKGANAASVPANSKQIYELCQTEVTENIRESKIWLETCRKSQPVTALNMIWQKFDLPSPNA